MNRILILSGPVGAGKTTVAQALVAAADGPTAAIEGDTFWSHLAKGAETRPQQKNFATIIRAMVAASLPYALSGYDVVLDFSIPPGFLDTIRKIVGSREVELYYVVLRPGEAVCAARAAARPEGRIDDYEPYREFYALFEEAPDHTIHDDSATPEAMAARIRQGLAAGRFRL